MKKVLSLIALAMIMGMTSCSPDPTPDPNSNSGKVSVVGSWYDEASNEEMRFGENGTFYDRYANYSRCAEVEGRWEYDGKNSKLTYYYPFMGQAMFLDWTVKNLKELSFTISSTTNGVHHLAKIVESYTLEVGKTANIKFSANLSRLSVISYTSNNERIASVTSDGVIKAEGEKGITYIKIKTTEVDVWVKVVVGDNCSDMWFDYVGLIGLDYANMRKKLSGLGEPYSGEDGYSFGFIHVIHDVVDYTQVFLCPEEGVVTEVQLLMKEAVPEVEILTYMNSHYYKMGENGSYIFYSSVKDAEASKAIIAYNKLTKRVIFEETQHFLHYPHVDLGNYYECLGMTYNQILSQYGKPYEENWNGEKQYLYYYVGTDYVNLAVFYIDAATNRCAASVVSINENVASSTIIDYLNSKYTVFAKGTYEDGSQYAWTNGPSLSESTMGITYVPANRLVTWVPLGSAANVKAVNRAVNVAETDKEFVKQVETKTSVILDDMKKTMENIKIHKSQQLKKALENYNK